MLLGIPLILCILTFIAGIIFFAKAKNENDEWSILGQISIMVTSFTFLICLIGIPIVLIDYTNMKGDYFVIDQKITLTMEINQQKIDSVIPILNKYPELEKEIVKGIDPNTFAVLGNVYPNLKSNESYTQQAEIVTENIKKLEDLKMQKIDLDRRAFMLKQWLWFLN